MKTMIPKLILSLGILLLVIGSSMRFENNYLPPGSPSTTATLSDDYNEIIYTKNSMKSTSFQITYTYSVNDIGYKKRERIGIGPQQIMTIFYINDNPDFAIIDFHRNSTHTCFDLIIAGVLFCIWGGLWLYMARAKKIIKVSPFRRLKPKKT